MHAAIKKVVIFILSVNCDTVYAQNIIYFDETYDSELLENHNEGIWGSSLFELGDSYMFASVTIENATQLSGLILVKIDLEGNAIFKIIQVDTNYSETYNTMVSTSDGNYVVASSATQYNVSEGDGKAGLTKLSHDGVVIWKKYYGNDTLREIGQNVIKTNDGGFALIGQRTLVSGENGDLYFVKTNEQGIQSWEKQYGGGEFEGGRSLVQTSDSGFLVLGWTRSFGLGERDFYLVKTDSIGNEEWYETYGTFRDEIGNSIILLSDGNYLLTGSGSQSSGVGSQGKIYKITSEGDLIWSKNYIYESNSGNNLHKTFELENSNLVSVGMTHGASDAGYLVKTNSLGEVIWQREYDYNDNTDLFYTMLPTSDGGFLLGGQAKHEFPLTQDAWLLKVDSMGCTYPNCTVGVDENDNTKVVADVWPNPASELLNIEFQNAEDWLVTLTDINGKVVYTTSTKQTKLSVNVLSFAAGVYVLQLVGEKSVVNKKIVVQK